MGNLGESCLSGTEGLEAWLECVPGEDGDLGGSVQGLLL